MELDAVAVVGPTASGKTRRAVAIARMSGGEIISADSRQLYKGMTIGTGKDLCEYGDIPYHLIDIAEAGEKFNLHRYLAAFRTALDQIKHRGKLAVVCGGTGMYVENALNGIRMPEVPENRLLRDSLATKNIIELESILRTYKQLHNKTDVDNCKRAIRAIEIEEYYRNHPEEAALTRKAEAKPLNSLVIGIDIPREERRQKITQRLEARINEGMIEEVKGLLDRGISADDLIYYGLEYKFVTLYVTGKSTYKEMFTNLETAIHQFAKRQMTWFRGMEKRGIKINWIPWDMADDELESEVRKLMEQSREQ